ncbi:MAG: hypothetical protein WAT22_15090 [Saprospiraceae bacterium]|nr:hypothetical protein [Saprospiraceae bacterium]
MEYIAVPEFTSADAAIVPTGRFTFMVFVKVALVNRGVYDVGVCAPNVEYPTKKPIIISGLINSQNNFCNLILIFLITPMEIVLIYKHLIKILFLLYVLKKYYTAKLNTSYNFFRIKIDIIF